MHDVFRQVLVDCFAADHDADGARVIRPLVNDERVRAGRVAAAGHAADDRHAGMIVGAVCNGRLAGGGHPLAPEARINDGLLDVVSFAPFTLPDVPEVAAELAAAVSAGAPWRGGRWVVRQRVPWVETESAGELPVNLDGEPMKVFGDGLQTRDYVYVDDVVDAFLRAEGGTPDITLNIGTGREVSVLDLVRILGGGDAVHAPARTGEVQRSALDAALAATVLGWTPTVQVEEGLPLTHAALAAARGV
jgi:hypothetical protein